MKHNGKFVAALEECTLHALVLKEALAALDAEGLPEAAAAWRGEVRRILDQLAYRFGKLQDTLGEKVFPGILTLAEEPIGPNATFSEKLQRLERLGVIDSVETWRALREMRNALAHEYPDRPELQAVLLRRFVQSVAQLLEVWEGAGRYVKRTWPDLSVHFRVL